VNVLGWAPPRSGPVFVTVDRVVFFIAGYPAPLVPEPLVVVFICLGILLCI
jgi:hypothetical protein